MNIDKNSVLYTEIRHKGGTKETTILYESNHKLYVSYVKTSPSGACGHYRVAKMQDYDVATLAFVEQLSVKIAH